MKKFFFTSVLIVLVLFGGVGSFAANAQTVSSGTGTATVGNATIAPGYTVLPVQNYDRADDEIVQLNNLTIQNVIGNTLYASREGAGGCSSFSSVQSSPQSIACPVFAPNVLYQISVSNDAILLLRTRARTSLGTFAVGDHINVFGFLDRQSQYMQALIVRDLDKPSVGSVSYYTQFNNVSAVTAPTASYPPTTMDIVFSPTPCALYSGPVGTRLNMACPYVPTGPSGVFMLAKHTVNITTETVILDQYRRTMPLAAVKAEDRLNIFGKYDPSTGTITALILRDLSSNGSVSGTGTLRVTVNDLNIQCFRAPCGPFAGIQVSLRGLNSSYSASGLTDGNGQAVFSGLNLGTYQVTAVSANGKSMTQNVTVGQGMNDVSVTISNSVTSNSLQVVSPNGGEVLTRNSQYQLRWNVPALAAGQYSVGNSFDLFLARKGVQGDAVYAVQYPIAKNVFLDFGMTQGTYQWSVGQTMDNSASSDGSNYYIRVCYAGTLTCDDSDAPFTITSAGTSAAPHMYSLAPSSGPAGTTVTLTGSGFASAGNIVHFVGANYSAYLPNITSNGTSLTFSAPGESSLACFYSTPQCLAPSFQLPAGTYAVSVENAQGTSNQLQFNLQPNAQVLLSSISPSAGAVGTTVTLTGSGFTTSANSNRVIFGQYQAAAVTSANGSSISFTLPSYLGANCAPNQACPMYALELQPGMYAVHVENANGISNNQSFQVY